MTTPSSAPPPALRPAQNVVSPGVHTLRSPGQWTRREAEIIASVIAPGLTPIELSAFAAVCRHTQLDPFRRQIYAWKDRGRITIHIAIDGLRAIAARTGQYAGQVGPEWCGPDGQWHDVWLREEPPAAARVGVRRRGWEEPLWATARWSEFARTQHRTGAKGPTVWDEKPAFMLAIRAESHALRRAFPELFDAAEGDALNLGTTIAIEGVDASEMPPLELAALDEPEEPAEQPETAPPVRHADMNYEAFYAGLLDIAHDTGVRPLDIPAYLQCENTPEAIHAAMTAAAIGTLDLMAAIKQAGEPAAGRLTRTRDDSVSRTRTTEISHASQ